MYKVFDSKLRHTNIKLRRDFANRLTAETMQIGHSVGNWYEETHMESSKDIARETIIMPVQENKKKRRRR